MILKLEFSRESNFPGGVVRSFCSFTDRSMFAIKFNMTQFYIENSTVSSKKIEIVKKKGFMVAMPIKME